MDEKLFEKRASDALLKLEAALRDAADELDADLAGDILTLEFEDGAKFIINSHSAAQQIWLSANLSAMHFGWHEPTSSWRDTKSGAELFTHIGHIVSEKLAQPVKLGN
jgi:CyaY protein